MGMRMEIEMNFENPIGTGIGMGIIFENEYGYEYSSPPTLISNCKTH